MPAKPRTIRHRRPSYAATTGHLLACDRIAYRILASHTRDSGPIDPAIRAAATRYMRYHRVPQPFQLFCLRAALLILTFIGAMLAADAFL